MYSETEIPAIAACPLKRASSSPVMPERPAALKTREGLVFFFMLSCLFSA